MALPITPRRCRCRCSWWRRLSAGALSLSLSLIIFRSSFFFVFRNALVRRGVERNTARYDALAPRHWSTGSARARPIGAARGRCKLLPPVESHPIRCPRRPTGFLLPVFPHLRTIVPTIPRFSKFQYNNFVSASISRFSDLPSSRFLKKGGGEGGENMPKSWKVADKCASTYG